MKIIAISTAITKFFNPCWFAVDFCCSAQTQGDTPFGRSALGQIMMALQATFCHCLIMRTNFEWKLRMTAT